MRSPGKVSRYEGRPCAKRGKTRLVATEADQIWLPVQPQLGDAEGDAMRVVAGQSSVRWIGRLRRSTMDVGPFDLGQCESPDVHVCMEGKL